MAERMKRKWVKNNEIDMDEEVRWTWVKKNEKQIVDKEKY